MTLRQYQLEFVQLMLRSLHAHCMKKKKIIIINYDRHSRLLCICFFSFSFPIFSYAKLKRHNNDLHIIFMCALKLHYSFSVCILHTSIFTSLLFSTDFNKWFLHLSHNESHHLFLLRFNFTLYISMHNLCLL